MHQRAVILMYSWWIFTDLQLAELQNIHPRVPYAPEEQITSTTPIYSSDQWRLIKEGAQYKGLLFAGRNEFNWIVDIRMVVFDKNLWSIGNLITSKYVLTTCRALMNFRYYFRTLEDMRVYFATQYLWEKHSKKSQNGDMYDDDGVSGERLVSMIWTNPRCTKTKLEWDTGILVVEKEIFPLLPGLGFMPIAIDPSTGTVVLDVNDRAVCYVASFGRRTRTRHEGPSHHFDFKVKYRVYPVSSSLCWKAFNSFCPPTAIDCPTSADNQKRPCYEVRARVGSICEHDRGAPIVCNDQVRGLVSKGASYDNCNAVIHVPFFAIDLTDIKEYFETLIDIEPVNPRNKSTQNYANMSRLLIYLLHVLLLI